MNPVSPLAAILAGALVLTLWVPTLAPVATSPTPAAALMDAAATAAVA